MSYLRVYVRRFGPLFLLGVVFLSGEALADLAQPTIMSHVVDVGVANRDIGYVLRNGALMLLIAGFGAVAASARNILASTVSQQFGADLRADLYRKTMSLTFASLDRFEIPTLVTRLTNDVNQLQNFFNGMMRIFVKAPLVMIGGIVMAILLDARLAIVLEIVLPVVATLVVLSLRIGYPRYRKVQQNLDRVNGVFREYLAGVRVVKAFNRFGYEAERFEAANRELSHSNTRAMRIMAVFTPGITLSLNLGIIAVLWLGGYRVNAGHIGAGHVIAFVNYMTQILMSLMMITFIFNTFVRARASNERIREVMETESGFGVVQEDGTVREWNANDGFVGASSSDLRSASGDISSAGAAARPNSSSTVSTEEVIRFSRVTFTYDSAGRRALPALRDVSFTVPRGKTLGIIGSTGSGKSTLVGLIPRFRDVTEGTVFVEGIDVRQFDPGRLRERIALVPQSTILFSGTIAENIRWGRDGASDDEVVSAARIAQALDFVTTIPEGFEARVGRGGVNLSGGQKQRLAIARAIIRRPRILILDDSSSALDAVTDARLREAIRAETHAVTLVIVAQRVTAVMNADLIVVLDDGNVAGTGTHSQLMQTCDVYRDIYRSQIGSLTEAGDVR